MNTPISAQVQVEIEELHQFFAAWFNGELPKTEAAYARFGGVLAADFLIINPAGQATAKPALLKGLWDAHGSQQAMKIWIENIHLRKVRGDVVWATYEEWQTIGGQTRARLSTVIFGYRLGEDPSLKWEHVHETWLPEAE